QMLEDLPMAVCSIGNDREILMWNHAMAHLTDISSHEILGSKLGGLPEPWRAVLLDFFEGDTRHLYKQRITLKGKPRWINLHKAATHPRVTHRQGGHVTLLADATETHRREADRVHSGRLAPVGRLAAGVAPEIGHPVTGIAWLAQNLAPDRHENESQEVAR